MQIHLSEKKGRKNPKHLVSELHRFPKALCLTCRILDAHFFYGTLIKVQITPESGKYFSAWNGISSQGHSAWEERRNLDKACCGTK